MNIKHRSCPYPFWLKPFWLKHQHLGGESVSAVLGNWDSLGTPPLFASLRLIAPTMITSHGKSLRVLVLHRSADELCRRELVYAPGVRERTSEGLLVA